MGRMGRVGGVGKKLLVMPSGFPALSFELYRNQVGEIKHSFPFADYYQPTATKIIVSLSGNDTTGLGSDALPYRTLAKAMTTMQAGADSSYDIVIKDVPQFLRDEAGFTGTISGKTVAIRSLLGDGYTAQTLITTNAAYSWVADGVGTYKATRSGVTAVSDSGARDANGVPIALVKTSSSALCQSTSGSWFSDGSSVWVHRSDGSTPSVTSTIVTIGVSQFDPILAAGSKLYLENLVFCGWANGHGLRVRGDAAGTNEEVVVNRCIFAGTTGNGYMTDAVAKTYLFNCVSAYQQLDAFNYTYSTMTWAAVRANTLVFEYGCTGYHCGVEVPGAKSNNTSTAHGGCNILRVGHTGYENTGATIIDVNGCYSVLYDCLAKTPINDGVYGDGTAMAFSADSVGQPGYAYIYHCEVQDCTVALNISTNTTAFADKFRRPIGSALLVGGTFTET